MQKYVIREDLHTAGHIEAWADYQLQRWQLPRNSFFELLILLLTKSLFSVHAFHYTLRRKNLHNLRTYFKNYKSCTVVYL